MTLLLINESKTAQSIDEFIEFTKIKSIHLSCDQGFCKEDKHVHNILKVKAD